MLGDVESLLMVFIAFHVSPHDCRSIPFKQLLALRYDM